MQGKAAPIVEWITQNVPPLTWTTIKLKHMNLFVEAKISPSKIDDQTIFNADIINCINDSLREKFGKEIPSNLLKV